MSKDDYARILVHAPSRLIFALAIAVGSGAGVHLVYNDGSGIQSAQREVDSCLTALANARSLADQHERDIATLADWAERTLEPLSEIQRMEALNRAPRVFSSAREVSR